ncbi:DoxX family protein [Streptomyces sp. NPDC012510]|uniref:DoxX family protein n=1 Tax=Streptomyces sp. NPDC012510 TaxID=3364838 RepID=UPI0036EE9BF6
MNIALWIVAAVLGVICLGGGVKILIQPMEKLAASGFDWVEDFDSGAVRTFGAVQALAGLGLILPAVLDIAPVLVPSAATALVLTMSGAAAMHLRRHETRAAAGAVVVAVTAGALAWGRFGPYSF